MSCYSCCHIYNCQLLVKFPAMSLEIHFCWQFLNSKLQLTPQETCIFGCFEMGEPSCTLSPIRSKQCFPFRKVIHPSLHGLSCLNLLKPKPQMLQIRVRNLDENVLFCLLGYGDLFGGLELITKTS